MLNLKDNVVYNNGKEIKTFDDENEAESFMTALSYVYGIDTEEENMLEKKNTSMITSIKEFKQYVKINEASDNIVELIKKIINQPDNVIWVKEFPEENSFEVLSHKSLVEHMTFQDCIKLGRQCGVIYDGIQPIDEFDFDFESFDLEPGQYIFTYFAKIEYK